MLLLRRISLVISCAYLLHDFQLLSAAVSLARSLSFCLLFIFARLLLLLLLFIFCLSFYTPSSLSLSLVFFALVVAFEKFMHVLAYL